MIITIAKHVSAQIEFVYVKAKYIQTESQVPTIHTKYEMGKLHKLYTS